ncbi:AAA family ATPase [uncultured Thiocystis sp.]|jgi:DamX protein|uniref:AAA family ATPase n=1 Tax=uncultured Thiocystis sp. TaxID=1202134 RepID=UPI0025EB8198|nr:AAA family ATPase [uncultured Thiocystis sp.]
MPLPPDCLARLKLRQPPFDAVPSEEFLYSDPLLESLIETAARALIAPGAIVILAGANGAGRSIQLMRLLGALGDNFEFIAFRGRAGIPFAAVDATIRGHLRAIGLDHPARSVKDLLAERSRAGVALVLAIDDAHLLGMEIVERLLRIRSEILELNGRGLRLILVGDPSLNRGRLPLGDPADENQVVRLNLRPLNLEQAGAYLRHRLRVAGIEDPETFLTSGDIAVLQTSSKGIPALLNANANAWLARRCRSVNGFKQAIAGKLGHLAGPSGTAAARVEPGGAREAKDAAAGQSEPASMNPEGILDLYDEDERLTPMDTELSRFLVHEDAREETADFEQVLRQIRSHTLRSDSQPTEARQPTPERGPGSSGGKAAVPYWSQRWFLPAILGSVVVSILVPVVLQLEDSSLRLPVETPRQADSVAAVERASGAAAGFAIAADQVRPRVSETDAPTVAPVAAAAESAAGEIMTPNPAPPPVDARPDLPRPSERTPASEPEPTPLFQPAPAPRSVDPEADQDWLLRQDRGRFTIQLVAARSLAVAQGFIAPHDLEGIHFIQTRSFAIALAGSYPNRAEAENALPKLPAGVRANGPWIRTIGSVLDSQR